VVTLHDVSIDPVHCHHWAGEIFQREVLQGLSSEIRTDKNAIDERCDGVSKLAVMVIAIERGMKAVVGSLRDMAYVTYAHARPVANLSSPSLIRIGTVDRWALQNAVLRVFDTLSEAKGAQRLQLFEVPEKFDLTQRFQLQHSVARFGPYTPPGQ
jgi:hypothetical protein